MPKSISNAPMSVLSFKATEAQQKLLNKLQRKIQLETDALKIPTRTDVVWFGIHLANAILYSQSEHIGREELLYRALARANSSFAQLPVDE